MIQQTNSNMFYRVIVALICLLFVQDLEAMKGKVPIYMPIPIPIPMPSQNHGVRSDHMRQHHRGISDDEGEVKKIYLFQPVTKIHPQQGAHMRGGPFMSLPAPVQTHIHMPAPILHQATPPQVTYTKSYLQSIQRHPESMVRDSHYQSKSSEGSSKAGNDFKILPIVVIPPMAPMAPIQLSNPTSSVQGSKLTVTPQVNNYVVSSTGTPLLSEDQPEVGISFSTGGKRRARQSTSTRYLQDARSFADFGFARGASNVLQTRVRHRQTRPVGLRRTSRLPPTYGSSSNGIGELRTGSDLNDQLDQDYENSGSLPIRNLASRRRLTSDRSYNEPYRGFSDELQQSQSRDTIFDDDPSNDLGRDYATASSNRVESSTDGQRSYGMSSQRQQFSGNPLELVREFVGQASSNGLADQLIQRQRGDSSLVDPLHDHAASSRHRQVSGGSSRPRGSEIEAQLLDSFDEHPARDLDMNSLYYERELPSDKSKMSLRHPIEASRHELVGEDEWRFESIKSVSHSAPVKNATETNSTIVN